MIKNKQKQSHLQHIWLTCFDKQAFEHAFKYLEFLTDGHFVRQISVVNPTSDICVTNVHSYWVNSYVHSHTAWSWVKINEVFITIAKQRLGWRSNLQRSIPFVTLTGFTYHEIFSNQLSLEIIKYLAQSFVVPDVRSFSFFISFGRTVTGVSCSTL